MKAVVLAPRRRSARRRPQGAGSRRVNNSGNSAAQSSSEDTDVFQVRSFSDLEDCIPGLQSSSQGQHGYSNNSQDELLQTSDCREVAELSFQEDSDDERVVEWDSEPEQSIGGVSDDWDVLQHDTSSIFSSPDEVIDSSKEDERRPTSTALFGPEHQRRMADAKDECTFSNDFNSTGSDHEAIQAKRPRIALQSDDEMFNTDEDILLSDDLN